MEKYIDVIQRTLELASTCLEGIQHVELRLQEGRYENTVVMLRDVLEGFYQIEQTVKLLDNKLPANKLEALADKLSVLLDKTVTAYEKEEYIEALKIIQTKLLRDYDKWQKELNKHLQPYVLS